MNAIRQIFKSATSAPKAARDVLTLVFAHELMVPSKTLYLVTPWVSNIVVFDNTLGEYEGLNPEWTRREIRLVDVLVALTSNDTHIVMRVRPDAHNKSFQTRLFSALRDAGLQDRCDWTSSEALHTKGLLTDHVLLSGSMNFTERGVAFNDESLTVSFDAQQIAQAKLEFESNHGIA